VETRVLGTSFNLTAYGGRGEVVTTLVSGSVEVFASGVLPVVLHPGERVSVRGDTAWVEEVDVSLATSWVHGKFSFDEATLEEIADRVSRWYDVEVVFAEEELKGHRFSGSMQRFRPLEHLIRRLEATSEVRCRVEAGVVVIDRE
jgi:ferric-dicitrate binding protein FerR (iron transport regulator)